MSRRDQLPRLFVSERQAQITGQAVNYIVRLAGEKAKLGRVWPHMLRHFCGYYLADRAPICARCRTTLDTAIASTRRTTRGSPAVGLKGFDGRSGGEAKPFDLEPEENATPGGVS